MQRLQLTDHVNNNFRNKAQKRHLRCYKPYFRLAPSVSQSRFQTEDPKGQRSFLCVQILQSEKKWNNLITMTKNLLTGLDEKVDVYLTDQSFFFFFKLSLCCLFMYFQGFLTDPSVLCCLPETVAASSLNSIDRSRS